MLQDIDKNVAVFRNVLYLHVIVYLDEKLYISYNQYFLHVGFKGLKAAIFKRRLIIFVAVFCGFPGYVC